MTEGARYGLGVALTAIGLVLASAGLVSLIDGGSRSGDVPPIALDETASDGTGSASGDADSGSTGGAEGGSSDAAGGNGARDRGGVAIGPAGPASGDDAGVTVTDGDDASADDRRRTAARARSTSGDDGPDPVPTADPVQVPVGAAGTPDTTDVSPDDVPTPTDDPPAPSTDDPPADDAPGQDDPPADDPPADDTPVSPAPEPEDPPATPTVDEVPVDVDVRGPASSGCDRGPDWPWGERAGSQGRGGGHGPPVGGCRGGGAVGAVATVLAAPTPLGVHWVVRMLFG